jgi:hypothetical protein
MKRAFLLLFVALSLVYAAQKSHAVVNRHHPGANRSVGSSISHARTYHHTKVRCNRCHSHVLR